MYVCLVCRFPVELDDVVVGAPMRGTCVCYRCFLRLGGGFIPMGKHLRQELTALLSGVGVLLWLGIVG